MQRAPASAPQPAHGADVRVQIAPDLLLGDSRSVPPPAQYASGAQPFGYGELFMFLFYNIGWLEASKKPHHNKENLADEICEMAIAKGADAIGICEIYNLRDTHLAGERQVIINHVLSQLNNSAQQPVWRGESDGHYMFLWNTKKLHRELYKYVSCEVADQPWRKAQYFRFQHAEKQTGPPLHVCHCHSPSSDKGKLTNARRATIFKALWTQVETNNPPGAAEPTAIFGGDYNCDEFEWSHCLGMASETEGSRRTIQKCISSYSEPAWKLHKGDRAIVFNGRALQENSRWGKRTGAERDAKKPPYFTDEHDLVVVPFYWRLEKVWGMNNGRWTNSKKSGSSSSSDAFGQNASTATQPRPQMNAEQLPRSAAQPAPTASIPKPIPLPRTIPKPPPFRREGSEMSVPPQLPVPKPKTKSMQIGDSTFRARLETRRITARGTPVIPQEAGALEAAGVPNTPPVARGLQLECCSKPPDAELDESHLEDAKLASSSRITSISRSAQAAEVARPRCFHCGNETDNPLRPSTYTSLKDNPHIACSLECMQKVCDEWIVIRHELQQMDEDLPTPPLPVPPPLPGFHSGDQSTGKSVTAITEPSPQVRADEASGAFTTYPVVPALPHHTSATAITNAVPPPLPTPLPTHGPKMSAEESRSATQPASPPLTAPPAEHALVAWSGEDDAGAHSAAHGQWNQLDANEQMLAVDTTFTEESYTTKLDPNSIPEEKRKAAERLAREIETGVAGPSGATYEKDAAKPKAPPPIYKQEAAKPKASPPIYRKEAAKPKAPPPIYNKEAAKPKAPPPTLCCAQCERPCRVVHWSLRPVRGVPTCGPICLRSHKSNALWRAEMLPRCFAAWQFCLAQPASPPEDTDLDDDASLTTDDEENWELDSSTMRYDGELAQAPSLIVPTHETPRLRALLQTLASTDDDYILATLADLTVFNPSHVSAEQPDRAQGEPYALAKRFENFLEVTDKQRQLYIRKLWSRGDHRVATWERCATLIFTETDMKDIMKSWKRSPATWSKNPHAQRRHNACHSSFQSMLFQLMGCKALVAMFIKYPICSAQQPASLLKDFAVNWRTWRESEERKAVQQMHKKKELDDPTRRLSTQIFFLRREQQIGEEMQRRIDRYWDSWYYMTDNQKRIHKDFYNGTIANKIREKQNMQMKQPAQFKGASVRMHELTEYWRPMPVQW